MYCFLSIMYLGTWLILSNSQLVQVCLFWNSSFVLAFPLSLKYLIYYMTTYAVWKPCINKFIFFHSNNLLWNISFYDRNTTTIKKSCLLWSWLQKYSLTCYKQKPLEQIIAFCLKEVKNNNKKERVRVWQSSRTQGKLKGNWQLKGHFFGIPSKCLG